MAQQFPSLFINTKTFVHSKQQNRLSSQEIIHSSAKYLSSDSFCVTDQLPLSKIIEDINSCLVQIAEVSLHQQYTQSFIEYLKKNQQMHHELEKKIIHLIDVKIQNMKYEIIQSFQQYVQYPNPKEKNQGTKSANLKITKKKIGDSLIQCSRSHLESKHPLGSVTEKSQNFLPLQSKLQPAAQQSILFCTDNEEYFMSDRDQVQKNMSSMLRLLEEKQHTFEKKQNKITKQLFVFNEAKFSEVAQIMRKNQTIILDLTQKLQEQNERIDASFEGLWNVITDLQRKITEIPRYKENK